MAGNGARAVQGIELGVTGGTAPELTGKVAGPVNLGQNPPPPMPKPQAPSCDRRRTGPRYSSNPSQSTPPRPGSFTSKALSRSAFASPPPGAVQVLGVTSGLGHGLDESAAAAVQATRFQPATDASGIPIDWEGIVNVAFQLAG